jgi:hypothetical protein
LKKQESSKKRITLCQDILNLSHEDLKICIWANPRELYGDEAKDEQVEAVAVQSIANTPLFLQEPGLARPKLLKFTRIYFNLIRSNGACGESSRLTGR